MKRHTPLRRRTPLKHGYRHQRQYRKMRGVVAERANGWCEADIAGVCDRRGVHAHHVLPRSALGTHDPANLLWVCAACHDYIHRHPTFAYGEGLLRRRGVS